jgi:hypothetical protein
VNVACDPGLHGAFAMFIGEESLLVFDMPTYTAQAGARHKDRLTLDETGIIALIGKLRLMGADRLVIEQVNGAPGQSSPAAFNFGYGCGFVVATARVMKLAVDRVPPQIWKRAMRAPADKRASRARASELLPAHATQWPLASHEGRAEAAMIALYAEKCL